jgi:hypothetical protein
VSSSVLFIALESIAGAINHSFGILVINTYTTWLVNMLILIIWFKGIHRYVDKQQIKTMKLVQFLLIWFILSFIRGLFIADDYWTWKILFNNIIGLLLPIAAYSLTNISVLQSLLRVYVKYTLPLFILFAFIIPRTTYGHYLMLGSLLLLFFPILKLSMKWLIGILTLVALTADFTARGTILRFVVPVLLVVFYYYRHLISIKLWEWMRRVLMIAPIVLFTLGVSGVFDVFNLSDYITGEYSVQSIENGISKNENLLANSRSLLYEEVLLSAQKNDYWIFGRSPARGNDTDFWQDQTEISGKNERFVNEAAILNVFTWTGSIGVILYFLVFYRATYLAVNKSNNIFSKMIGVSLAFRWLWSWISDSSSFNIMFFSIWVLIALSFSDSFRRMSNLEVKYWVRGITDKRFQYKILVK